MEKYLVTTRQARAGERMMTLQYYVLKERRESTVDQFGIMIRLWEESDMAVATGISEDGLEVLELIKKLADGSVTPVSLEYVLADLQ